MAFATDLHVVIFGRRVWADEIKLKLKLGTRRREKSFITMPQKIEKILLLGRKSDRNSADLDASGFSGGSNHVARGSA
jgi:hypothetical protein